MSKRQLVMGFVPEHFSTPLAFAQKHYGLDAELRPFTQGTGHLASSLKTDDPESRIDIAIGLTEGFVADLGKAKAAGEQPGYGLVGTYVESPLCWAISTGAARKDISQVADVKGKRCAVSRIGSGSYVMSFVLADQEGWLQPSSSAPFEHVVSGAIDSLTDAVTDESKADFFMWEHFTTKYLWDKGVLKKIGEIYTPWPSWMIAARRAVLPDLPDLFDKINRGVAHYVGNPDEAVQHISSTMHYSSEDARQWMGTVEFSKDVRGVDPAVVDHTVGLLRKAGVLTVEGGGSEDMVGMQR